MRISPISGNVAVNQKQSFNNGRKFRNQNCGDTFVSFTGGNYGKFGLISDKDLENICTLIKESDEARLDGSIQGIYRFGDFMVKAPETEAHSSPIKEFYALMRLNAQKSTAGVAPQPAIVSAYGNRHYVVEEFVQGEHAQFFPFKLKDVDNIIGTLLDMDKAGIVNQDLSPSNFLITPDKKQRIVDFDTFSFLSEDGKVMHSSGTPVTFFSQRAPHTKLVKTGYSKLAGSKYSKIKEVTPEEMFARSFAYTRKKCAGLEDLDHIRAMSDNPYINMPSNLGSYEARTIYKRIADRDVDNPVEFMKQYLKRKSDYHSKMQEYLQGMKIPDDIMEYQRGRLSYAEADEALKKARFYEGFLSKIYGENCTDKYFAKLETAKMQLGAFLYDDNLSKHATNKSQIHNAYEKVIKIITDGLETYTDSDRQLYLKNELKRYTEAFSGTDFSITSSKQKVLDSLDIVSIWFGDRAVDLNSFQAAKDRLKKNAMHNVSKHFEGIKTGKAPDSATIAEGRRIAEESIRDCFENVMQGRVPESRVDKGVAVLVEEVIRDTLAGRFQDPDTNIWYNAGETAKKTAKQKIAEEQDAIRRAAKLARETNTIPVEEGLTKFARSYQSQTYVKNGGRILAAAGALIAFGGFILYGFKKYKAALDEKESQQKQSEIKNVSVLDMVSSKENNPFKDFMY